MLDHITTCIFVEAPRPTSLPIVCSMSTLQGILEFWPHGLLANLFVLLDSNHSTMQISDDGSTGMANPLASCPVPFSSFKHMKAPNNDGHLGPRLHRDTFKCMGLRSQEVPPFCTQLIPVSMLLLISAVLTMIILCFIIEKEDSQESLVIQGVKFGVWHSFVCLHHSFAVLVFLCRCMQDTS